MAIENVYKYMSNREKMDYPRRLYEKVKEEGLGWVFILKELERRGYELEYRYGNRTYDHLIEWEYDSKMTGLAPKRPDEVKVYNFNGRERKLVARIKGRSRIDPDFETTFELFDYVSRR